MADHVTLCLTGDVMTGRGIDQILRHPGHPGIFERRMRSAVGYVELAEQRVGPIPRPVEPEYVWGDVLEVLHRTAPDAFIVNLETAVTDQGTPWPDKGIHYRMHPANVEVLAVAGVDAAVLANNHVLDWSFPGLAQTLDVVRGAGVAPVGAGRDAGEAWSPVAVDTADGRVLVVAAATPSSGIPWDWAADVARPGVALLAELTDRAVERIAAVVASAARPGDVVVLSIHWGPNWGYGIPAEHQRFARALVERAGVHVVHGHSSHHPLGVEVHCGRLILYGCGDLITDYEGISGHEPYRGELGALYLPTIDHRTGTLERLEVAPTKVERFRLNRPPPPDVEWLATMLQRECSALGTSVTVGGDTLVVRW
jgi:poly-gamma-glutamate capsule biosynthesis protein CapA/YwtB (metallophosphatase superfamily)